MVITLFFTKQQVGYSQTPNYINFSTLDVNNNINLAYTRKCIEDKNGFIWICTPDGLNRFDGKNVLQFTKNSIETRHRVISADCYDMAYKAGDSLLYVINPYDGLNIININSNIVSLKKSEQELGLGLDKQWLKSSLIIKNYLFLLTDSSLLRMDTRSGAIVIKKLRVSHNTNFEKLFLYQNNPFIINSSFEVFRCDIDMHTLFKISDKIRNNELINYVSVNEDYMYTASDDGISVFDLKNKCRDITNLLLPGIPESLLKSPAKTILKQGDTILFSNNKGFFYYNIRTNTFNLLLHHSEFKSAELENATDILITNEMYCISNTYGVALLPKKQNSIFPVNNITTTKGSPINVFGICVSGENVYVAAQNSLYKYNKQTLRSEEILPGKFVYSIVQLAENEILFSATDGLYFLQNSKLSKASVYFPELKILNHDRFISMRIINKTEMILGSENTGNVFLWNKKNHSVENLNQTIKTLNENLINNITVKNKDSIYIIGELYLDLLNLNTRQSQTLLKQKDLGHYTADVFMDACSAAGYTWIAAYGLGIIKLNANRKIVKIIGTEGGLNNAACFKIFNVRDSFIILTTNNGLSVYAIQTGRVQNFFTKDGLHGNVFNEASGFQDDSAIYAGGLGGCSIISTASFNINSRAPSLFWNGIFVDAGEYSFNNYSNQVDKCIVPSNTEKTSLHFAGLNFSNPDRITYSYNIIELGKEWIELGKQDMIDLIGLPPGKYHISITAFNEDGFESKPLTTLLIWQPHWYQTWWFRFGILLCVCVAFYIFYQYRIRQVKKIISIRRKISADLHDDIGSTLSSISIYTEMAQLQAGNTSQLGFIKENTKEVLEKLDDIVWATNPKNDSATNLAERINNFGRELFKGSATHFAMNADPQLETIKINELLRQTIYLIAKEGLNNAAKYAQGSDCTVHLFVKQKAILLSIVDNGIGFDTSKSSERNGLLNIKFRATALKGKALIDSIPGKGTNIKVSFPL